MSVLWFRGILIGGFLALIIGLNTLVMPPRLTPLTNVEQVPFESLSLVIRAPGRLEPKSSMTIKSQFEGDVVSKSFREGQKVKAGDLLAIISTDKIRIEHQEKQNELINAKSALSRARKEVNLQKSLYNKEAVAYSSVEEAQTNLTRASQALRAAEEGWKLEQLRWNSGKVVAPLSGTVIRDGLGDEKSVATGKEIITIADISEFTVQARVDELDIKRVTENQSAEVRLPLYPDKLFQARVTQIGSQTDSAESTAIPVELTLVDSQGVLLRPKLTADVRIVIGQTAPLLSVPLVAIHNTDGTPKVWVLDRWQRLRGRVVTLGQSNPERTEVTKGLRKGERICAEIQENLAEGMRVRIEGSAGTREPLPIVATLRALWAKAMQDKSQ
jgi:RND family efflux transporter MFP subunit